MDLAHITFPQLLAIPTSEPERLFSGPNTVSVEYKAFAKILHPDMSTGNTDAFQHLQALHVTALAKVKIGEWKTPGLLSLRGDDGQEKRIHFLKEFDSGVGHG